MGLTDGAGPIGGLTLSSGGNDLYGTTSYGGDGDGRAFTLGTLSGTPTYGQYCNFDPTTTGVTSPYGTPLGDLLAVSSGANTLLYGAMAHLPDPDYMTDGGGPNDYGFIFHCDQIKNDPPNIDATFTTVNLPTLGGLPTGKIVAGGGTPLTLYGTVRIGGANNTGLPVTLSGPNAYSYVNTGGTIYMYVAGTNPQLVALHSFGGSVTGPGGSQADGVEPVGGLTGDGLTPLHLYGTTATGGTSGLGTIFKCTVSGTTCSPYVVLYNFTASTDGMAPTSPLIYMSTGLYGTTSNGGPNGGGTLFKYVFSGSTLSVLKSFHAAGLTNTDGANPSGDLVYKPNAIWGTTWQGGIPTGASPPAGFGTIYSYIGTTFTTQYAFTGGADGENPFGGLTYAAPTPNTPALYGTTHGGGLPPIPGIPGAGTIFSWPAQ